MFREWEIYQSQTASGQPRSLLVQALSYVSARNTALDLGAGALNEVQYLLDNGFKKVVAVDMTKQFKEIAPGEASFTYIESKIEDYAFSENYFDLISSQYALPFIERAKFAEVWGGLTKSLKDGGIFCGQLFGKKDEWSKNDSIISHSREDVETLIKNLDVLFLKEVEKESLTANGEQKHWHYFELILKKK